MSEKQFPEGIRFFKPYEKAPDFVKGVISIQPQELETWMKENMHNVNKKGYLMLDLKQSKGGKLYLDLSTYHLKNNGQDKSNTTSTNR